MPKKIVGVDFGSSEVKFAVLKGSVIEKTVSVQTPENFIRNGMPISQEAMAEFIRDTASREKLRGSKWALVLSPSQSYTRCMTVPLMSANQLELNLPYEFRDYIVQGKDKYHFDYAVLETREGEGEDGGELDLMASAALKSTLLELQATFRQAKKKLKLVVPEEFAYRNLIRQAFPDKKGPVCLIDLGHTSTRIHIFNGDRFEVSRIIDYGGASLDAAISEVMNMDMFVAHTRKHANHNKILEHEECMALYRNIALEIMRAVNFYNYDGEAALDCAYIMGGGALNKYLLEEVKSSIGLEIRKIEDILPKSKGDNQNLCLFAAAIGAAQQ